jgi:hypothetical protein
MSTTSIVTPEEQVHVFVSYAREDKRWLDEEYRYSLIPFLMESLRRHSVTFWFDTELKPGDEFKRHIEAKIDQSQIALLIVSQNFLNSGFIERHEMPRIAERAQQGKMIVVPVLVEPCDWSDYPFLADRQMVPSASPLIDFTESESKWARVRFQILDGLKAQLKRIRETPQPATGEGERPAAAEPVLPPRLEPRPEPRPEEVAAESRRVPWPVETGPVVRPGTAQEQIPRRPGEWNYGAAPVVVPGPTKIPEWAWGAVAVFLLLIGIFVGMHFLSHPTPTPTPSQQTPASNPNPTQTTQVPALTGTANAPSSNPTPERPSTTPTTPVAPANNGGTLADTMTFIQDELNSLGKVSYVGSGRNTTDNSTFQYTESDQVSNVVASTSQCRVSYHFAYWQNGATQPGQDVDTWFALSAVVSVVVEPMPQYITSLDVSEGKPNLIVVSTTPTMSALIVRRSDNQLHKFSFANAGLASQVGGALKHAVQLCGGKIS